MAYIITSKTKQKSNKAFQQLHKEMESKQWGGPLPDCCYSGMQPSTQEERDRIDSAVKYREKGEKEFKELQNYVEGNKKD